MSKRLRICACGCGGSLAGLRADALYQSEACKKRAQRAASRDKAGTSDQPLQLVRDQRATAKHNRDLGGLIKRAIVDTIRLSGECHADDLIPLYPASEVGKCRRLATAQFGSLCAPREGHEPQLREKERRKSSIPERKGAKSGVYVFTKYGRESLVGSCADTPGEAPVGAASSEKREETIGLTAAAEGLGRNPRSGRSSQSGGISQGVDRKSPPASVDPSPELQETPAGEGTAASVDQGRLDSSSTAGLGSPGVLQLDGARKAPTMFDPYEGQAA